MSLRVPGKSTPLAILQCVHPSFFHVSEFVCISEQTPSVLGLMTKDDREKGPPRQPRHSLPIASPPVYVREKKRGAHYIFMSPAIYSVLLSDLWECIL